MPAMHVHPKNKKTNNLPIDCRSIVHIRLLSICRHIRIFNVLKVVILNAQACPYACVDRCRLSVHKIVVEDVFHAESIKRHPYWSIYVIVFDETACFARNRNLYERDGQL